MPRKTTKGSEQDPVVELKRLALRDDRDVHKYRNLLYHLAIDSMQATGQRIASGERCAVLSNVKRKQLLKELAEVHQLICSRYNIPGIHGGDPWNTKKADWVDTIRVTIEENPRIETNWKTSLFSPRVQFRILPKSASVRHSKNETLYKLPSLPESPANCRPIMSFHVDLSQVKRNNLAPWLEKFNQAMKQCLDEVPKPLKKPASLWEQNINRDYERFRLFREGMTFRKIAYQERTGRTPQGRVSGSVPKETSIRESVERVHLILFGHSANDHKTSARDEQIMHISKTNDTCPLHGNYCLPSCDHARRLQKQIDALCK